MKVYIVLFVHVDGASVGNQAEGLTDEGPGLDVGPARVQSRQLL